MKAHPAAQGIVRRALFDKHPSPLTRPDQTSVGQRRKGMAHGVAVNPEAGGQCGLRRKPVAGAVVARVQLPRRLVLRQCLALQALASQRGRCAPAGLQVGFVVGGQVVDIHSHSPLVLLRGVG